MECFHLIAVDELQGRACKAAVTANPVSPMRKITEGFRQAG
jgi:hypothetical protein